jgi:hypothetical protein
MTTAVIDRVQWLWSPEPVCSESSNMLPQGSRKKARRALISSISKGGLTTSTPRSRRAARVSSTESTERQVVEAGRGEAGVDVAVHGLGAGSGSGEDLEVEAPSTRSRR